LKLRVIEIEIGTVTACAAVNAASGENATKNAAG